MLLHDLNHIIALYPPLIAHRIHRLSNPTLLARRLDVPHDALLPDDSLPAHRAAGRTHHLFPPPTPASPPLGGRARPPRGRRNVHVLLLVAARENESRARSQSPEEPEKEEKPGDAAQNNAHDGAGGGPGVEALVDGGDRDGFLAGADEAVEESEGAG